MRPYLYRWLASLALILCVGCASVPTKQNVALPDLGKPIENTAKARIYVFRTIGGRMQTQIDDGAVNVGATGTHGFLCWEREPGQMLLQLRTPGAPRDLTALKVKAGNVYYFKQTTGWISIILEEIQEPEAQKYMQSCKPDSGR